MAKEVLKQIEHFGFRYEQYTILIYYLTSFDVYVCINVCLGRVPNIQNLIFRHVYWCAITLLNQLFLFKKAK